MITKQGFAEQMRTRTRLFSVRSIRLFQALPPTNEARIVGKQFLRAATSMAANYRAVCRARSKAEFYAKLSITVEEADETLFWLELITESGIMPAQRLTELQKEAGEIIAILATARSNAN